MNKIAWGIMLLFTCFGCSNTVQNDKVETTYFSLAKKVDEYMKAQAANHKFSGNLLIAKGDSMVYSKSFGVANRTFGIDNSDSTKFLIGSVTKPFTAFAILLLAKEGKVALDDKLSKYFPDFPDADKVTIKQLLTHTSGIKDYHAFDTWVEESKSDKTTPESTIEKVASNPFIFEPGTRFSYTNSGYILLGLVIEQVSNQSFESFIQSKILYPLEMHNTGVITNEKIVPNLAQGYTTSPRSVKKAAYINYRQPYASGNMYSTPADLWKFTQAVMNSSLLSKEETEEIFNVSEQYGYGWGIRQFDGIKAYGHHGGMNGFVGSITYIPSKEYFICFLTNDDNTPKFTISEDLASMVLGKEVSIPTPTEYIAPTSKMTEMVVGNYLVKAGDTLCVFSEDKRLYLQETGQPKHELFPASEYEYTFTLFEFNAVFSDLKDDKTQTLNFVGKSSVTAQRVAIPSKK